MVRILPVLLLFLLSCGGESIYDLEFQSLDGKTFKLSRFKGKEFVVYVWSGTCVGHVEDLKALVNLAPRLKVPVISIAIMMDVEDIKKVLEKNHIEPSYPVLADPRGRFADKVTLVFLPATIIFDAKGRVVKNYPKLPESLISLVPTHE